MTSNPVPGSPFDHPRSPRRPRVSPLVVGVLGLERRPREGDPGVVVELVHDAEVLGDHRRVLPDPDPIARVELGALRVGAASREQRGRLV